MKNERYREVEKLIDGTTFEMIGAGTLDDDIQEGLKTVMKEVFLKNSEVMEQFIKKKGKEDEN